jgi:coenzyme F420-0:L-glutamate ligase/coenzyme F420-1:gamma-L-glutamate ligase
MMPLVITPLPDFPLIQKGDDLSRIVLQSIEKTQIILQDGDIFVLAQKVVSKAEGRLVYLPDVTPSPKAEALAAETEKDARMVEMILRESRQVLRSRSGLIIAEHKLGFICANAGIDHSNVAGSDEWVLLLPENPDASAQAIRHELEKASGARLGILIIDSHGRPWRNGAVGVTIGLSGFPALVDLRGEIDLFGYEMKVTQVGASDELAGAASLMMGQVAEGTPVVHVRGFPYPLREASLEELLRPEEQDLFR